MKQSTSKNDPETKPEGTTEELPQSFAAEVWNRLSKIDCTEHIKLIDMGDGIAYLPWAHAWHILMENYPESFYNFSEPVRLDNGTVEVWVRVSVVSGDRLLERAMWLPVMGPKSHSIQDPTSREISDCRMRCLVKAIAIFGLGIYVYAREDYPRLEDAKVVEPVVKISENQAMDLVAMITEIKADRKGFLNYFGIETEEDLPAKRLEEAIEVLEKIRKRPAKKPLVKKPEEERHD